MTYLGIGTLAFQLLLPLSGLCVLRWSEFPSAITALWNSAASTWEPGETCSLAPNFRGIAHRTCLESLSGVAGPKTVTRSQYLSPAFSEIKLLLKWNWGCTKPAEQLAWVETTSLSWQGVPGSGWESPSRFGFRTSRACVLADPGGWALGLLQWLALSLPEKIEDRWQMASLVLREGTLHERKQV